MLSALDQYERMLADVETWLHRAREKVATAHFLEAQAVDHAHAGQMEAAVAFRSAKLEALRGARRAHDRALKAHGLAMGQHIACASDDDAQAKREAAQRIVDQVSEIVGGDARADQADPLPAKGDNFTVINGGKPVDPPTRPTGPEAA